jgi:uncharacterized protein YkwD
MILLASCTPSAVSPPPDQTEAVSAQPSSGLAEVSAIEILTAAGSPDQIRILVRGSLQDTCDVIDEPVVNRQDYRFSISLSFVRQSGEACVSRPQDYEKTIPLDLSGLPDGEYTISVNGSAGIYLLNSRITQVGADTEPTTSPQPTGQPMEEAPVATGQLDAGPQPVEATPRGCNDLAAFFGDVTIPDNTPFEQNTPFTKTWAIRNEGTCTWDGNYALVFAGGDPMNGPLSAPLPQTQPGEVMKISVDLTSPVQGGLYTGYYEFINPEGRRFGVNSGGVDSIWVTISVRWYKPGESEPSAGIPVTAQNPSCGYSENSSYVSQLLELINQARANQGLSSLELDSRLSAAAMKHSIDMGCQGFLDHVGSDGSKYGQRVKAEGYNYSYVSENIYAGSPDFGGNAQGAFDWWMNSTVHRNNILSTKVSQIGIGYASVPGSPYGGYYTLNFARP